MATASHDLSARNRTIHAAHAVHQYTLREIGDHVHLHYTTVSRIIGNQHRMLQRRPDPVCFLLCAADLAYELTGILPVVTNGNRIYHPRISHVPLLLIRCLYPKRPRGCACVRSLPCTTSLRISPLRNNVLEGRISISTATISPGLSLFSPRCFKTGCQGVDLSSSSSLCDTRSHPLVTMPLHVCRHGGAVEMDFSAGRIQLPDADDQVHIISILGRDPEPQLHVAGQLGIPVEGQVELRTPLAGS